MLTKDGIFLTCHGIDTVSSIYINSIFLGNTDNMFIRYKFNIKQHLRRGTNTIRVAFESPVTYATRKHEEQKARSYSIPPLCPPSVQRGECHPNFIRKMQASFGWDWVSNKQLLSQKKVNNYCCLF